MHPGGIHLKDIHTLLSVPAVIMSRLFSFEELFYFHKQFSLCGKNSVLILCCEGTPDLKEAV